MAHRCPSVHAPIKPFMPMVWSSHRGSMGMSRNVGNARDERGAVLVLTAFLVPALIALGALSIGITSLWAEHDDVQRAVDLGALAGAADTPTLDAASMAATFPAAIGGIVSSTPVGSALDPTRWDERPCAVTAQQLASGRSTMVNAFKTADGTCTKEWQFESPFLAAAYACSLNVLDVASCSSKLTTQLGVTLTPLTDPAMTTINGDAATVV